MEGFKIDSLPKMFLEKKNTENISLVDSRLLLSCFGNKPSKFLLAFYKFEIISFSRHYHVIICRNILIKSRFILLRIVPVDFEIPQGRKILRKPHRKHPVCVEVFLITQRPTGNWQEKSISRDYLQSFKQTKKKNSIRIMTNNALESFQNIVISRTFLFKRESRKRKRNTYEADYSKLDVPSDAVEDVLYGTYDGLTI